MRNRDKKALLGLCISCISSIIFFGAAFTANASQLTVPHSFSAGTTISSSDMNGNFTAVQSAINDTDTRVSNLEKRKVTVLTFTGGNNGYNTAVSWTQYTFISPSNLTFTKNSATSTILVTWNDTIVGHSLTGGLGLCNWDLRIDGVGNSTSFLNIPLFVTSDAAFPISFTATYTGLAAGAHDVQLWLNTTNAGCYNNSGGWTRTVTVQEVP